MARDTSGQGLERKQKCAIEDGKECPQIRALLHGFYLELQRQVCSEGNVRARTAAHVEGSEAPASGLFGPGRISNRTMQICNRAREGEDHPQGVRQLRRRPSGAQRTSVKGRRGA